MSPHGTAGPLDQSSPNSGNKCQLARPLKPPNFIALRQKVFRISAFKNFLPRRRGKLDQSSPKLPKTCHGPNAHHCAKFHRTLSNDVRETCYKLFIHLCILAPRGPLGQSSPILKLTYSMARLINVPNFIPCRQPAYEISAAKLC